MTNTNNELSEIIAVDELNEAVSMTPKEQFALMGLAFLGSLCLEAMKRGYTLKVKVSNFFELELKK